MTTKLLCRAIACAALTLSAFFSLAANSFAVTVGQTCPTSFGGPPVQFQSSVSSGASFVMPSDGVLTSWTTDRTNYLSTGLITAAIGSKTGSNWSILATSPYQYIAGGLGTFPLRMSVKAGQTLGTLAFTGSTATVCTPYDPTGDQLDYANSFQPNGTFLPAGSIAGARANISATLEADADQDGYGDETQDKCPQSAAWQNPCPELKITQLLSATRSEIKVAAATTVDTTLTATATVTFSSKKKVTIKGKPTAFAAGSFKTIKLKLPASVKNALKKKRLKATVTLTGNGLANTATATSKITLKKKS